MIPHHEQDGGKEGKEAYLNQEQPPKPSLEAQVAQSDLAEREEEHSKEQRGLNECHRLFGQTIGAVGPWKGRKDEIGGHSDHHGDRQCPLTQKIDPIIHGAKVHKKRENLLRKEAFLVTSPRVVSISYADETGTFD